MSRAIAVPVKEIPQFVKVTPEIRPGEGTTLATSVTDVQVVGRLESIISEIQKLRVIVAVGLDTDINPEENEMEEVDDGDA